MAFTATSGISSAGSIDRITALENAVHAWVVTGSRLAADRVIWGGRGPAPSTGTYIDLWLSEVKRISSDWQTNVEVDGQIHHHIRGTRHPTLRITCYAGDRFGSARPEAIIDRVMTAAALPSISQALQRAGVGIGPRGTIRVIPGQRSQMFDPRASVEVMLHTVVDISEQGYSIERVNAQFPGRPAGWIPGPPP